MVARQCFAEAPGAPDPEVVLPLFCLPQSAAHPRARRENRTGPFFSRPNAEPPPQDRGTLSTYRRRALRRMQLRQKARPGPGLPAHGNIRCSSHRAPRQHRTRFSPDAALRNPGPIKPPDSGLRPSSGLATQAPDLKSALRLGLRTACPHRQVGRSLQGHVPEEHRCVWREVADMKE